MPGLGPRLVIAGTHSGVGKTTVATGLMAAYRAAGVRVASAKVGPDFLDPGYHSVATGRAPRNLDPWLSGPEAIGPLAARAGAGAELLIVEGVMGLFDGAVDGTPSSTADVAAMLSARREQIAGELDRRVEPLRDCLGELPPQQRALVEEYYFDQSSIQEIATQVGRSGEALYKSLQRIRMMLLKCVNGMLASPEAAS